MPATYGYMEQAPGPGKERPWRSLSVRDALSQRLRRSKEDQWQGLSRRPLSADAVQVSCFAGASPRR